MTFQCIHYLQHVAVCAQSVAEPE